MDREDLWYHVPGVEFLTNSEYAQAYPMFFQGLEDVKYGSSPQSSQHMQDFLEYMGMTERDFPWDEFREWIQAVYEGNDV